MDCRASSATARRLSVRVIVLWSLRTPARFLEDAPAPSGAARVAQSLNGTLHLVVREGIHLLDGTVDGRQVARGKLADLLAQFGQFVLDRGGIALQAVLGDAGLIGLALAAGRFLGGGGPDR